MSKVIDNAIVSMEFQNEDFEKGVSQSLSTLEKLQTALNATNDKGLQELEKTDLSKLGRNVDKLSDRFTVVGEKIHEIKTALLNLALSIPTKALNFAIGGIVEGGFNRAMNIEKARFSLEALFGEGQEDRIEAVMKDVSASVKDTRYSLDDAAKAATSIVTSGRRASEEGGQLLNDLRGMVGVASMTNSELSDIANIYQNIAGSNKVLGRELNMLAARGLNAAEIMAEYMRKVFSGEITDAPAQAVSDIKRLTQGIENASQITGQFVKDLISDRKSISFDIFSASMEESFAKAAYKSNQTWEGSIANLRAALARIGEGFYAPLVKKNSEFIRLFNALREKVNDFKDTLVFDEKLGNTMALTKQLSDAILNIVGQFADFVAKIDVLKVMELFYNVVEVIKNVFKALWSYASPFFDAISEIFGETTILDTLILITRKLEELTSYFILTDETIESVKNLFKGFVDILKVGVNLFTRFTTNLFGINKQLTRSSPLNETKEGFLGIADSVGTSLSSFARFIDECKPLTDALDTIAKYGNNVINFFKGIGEHIGNFFNKLKSYPILQTIYNGLITAFNFAKNNILPILKTVFGVIAGGFIYLISNAAPILKTIGSFIGEIFTKITSNLGNVGPILKGFGDTLKGLFSKVTSGFSLFDKKDSNILGESTTTLLDEATKGFDKIKTFFSSANGIKIDGLDKLTTKASDSFKNFAVKNGVLDSATKNMDKFGISFESFKISKEPLKEIGNFFSGVANGFKKTDDSTKQYEGNIVRIRNATQDLGKVGSSKNAWSKVFTDIGNFFIGFIDTFRYKILPFFSDKKGWLLLAGGGFLTILTKNLFGFSKVIGGSTKLLNGKFDGFFNLLDVFFGRSKSLTDDAYTVAGSFQSLAKTAKSLEKSMSKELNSKAFLRYAAGIVGVALALGYLANNVNPLKLLGVGLIIDAVIGILSLVIYNFFRSLSQGTLVAFSRMVISFAISLGIAVAALTFLFKMDLPEDWWKKILIITGVMVGMMGILKLIKPTQGDNAKLGTFIGIALLLYSIVKSIEKIFKMEIPVDFEDKLKLLGGAVTALILTILSIGGSSYIAGLSGGSVNGMLEALVGAAILLWRITAELEKLMKMEIPADYETKLQLFSGVIISLCGVIVIIGVAAAIAGITNGGFAGLGLAIIGAAVLLWEIMNALQQALTMEIPEDWPLRLGLFALAILALCGVIIAIGFAGKLAAGASGLGGAILATCLLVVSIALSLAFLSFFDFNDIAGAAFAMGIVFVAIGICLKLGSKILNPIWAELLATCLLVGVIATSLFVLATIDFKNLLSAALALSGVLLAIGFVLQCASSLRTLKSSVGIVAAIALLGVIAFALVQIDEKVQDWQKLLGIAGSIALLADGLGVMMLAIAGAIRLLSGVKFLDGLAGIGLICAAILAIIGTVVLALAGLGKLMRNEDIRLLMEDGVQFFALVGKALGSFVDAFITFATQGLGDLGKRLSEFYNNAKPFFDGVNNVKEETAKGAMYLAETIGHITNANLVNALTSWLTGGQDLGKFGEQLGSVADGIKNFSDVAKDINEKNVDKGMKALNTVIEGAKEIPNTGGLLGRIVGNNDIGPFIKQLNTKVCNNLVEFGNSMSKMPDDIADKAKDLKTIFESLKQLGNAIPNSGGFFGDLFVGNKNETFKIFGQSLTDIAPGLEKYASAMSKISPDIATSADGVAKSLVELTGSFNSMVSYGDEKFNTRMTTITTWMGNFGISMSKFYDKIKEIDVKKILATNEALISITKLADADYLALSEISGVLEDFANEGIKSFINAFDDAHDNGRKAIQYFIEDSVKPFSDEENINKMVGFGTKFIKKFLGGFAISNDDKEFTRSIGRFITSVASQLTIKENIEKLEKAGANAAAGFIRGYNSKIGEVEKASNNIGNAAKDGLNRNLKIQSPSKEMEWSGEMAGEGFANGIENSEGGVEKSTEELGEIIKKASTKIMNDFSKDQIRLMVEHNKNLLDTINADNISENMDLQPTITPVVDLSNVQRSSDDIADMFNSGTINGGYYGSQARYISQNFTPDNYLQIMERCKYDDTRLINEINNINNNLFSLSQKVDHMQVILDSGTLVGEITPMIDASLGRRINRQSRL